MLVELETLKFGKIYQITYTCMMAMKCCTTVCSLKTQILLKVGKHFLFSLNTGIQIILIELLERSGTNSIWLLYISSKDLKVDANFEQSGVNLLHDAKSK